MLQATCVDRVVTGRTSARFQVRATTAVRLRYCIHDLDGNAVFCSEPRGALAGESVELAWDGTGCRRAEQPRAYLVRILARRRDSDLVSWGMPWERAEVRVHVPEMEGEEATIVLQEPALLRVRAGKKGGGAVMRTLEDWMPHPAGRVHLSWDGCDPGHRLCLQADRMIVVEELPLPPNAVIVASCPPAPGMATDGKVDGPLGVWPERRALLRRAGREYWRHWQRDRVDPEVRLRWRAGGAGGRKVLEIDLPPAGREAFLRAVFEANVYVDGTFLVEEEVGFLPYGMPLDEGLVGPGRHAITVNLLDSRGYVATGTIAWPGDAEGEPRGDDGQ